MPFFSNIGPGELIIVAVIVLLIFGPGRLPDVGQALGKGIREFRKAATDVTEATRLDSTPTPSNTATPGAAADASTPPATTPAPSAAPVPPPAPAPGVDGDRDSTVA
jgi:sec-independent protein translocase protein TatA